MNHFLGGAGRPSRGIALASLAVVVAAALPGSFGVGARSSASVLEPAAVLSKFAVAARMGSSHYEEILRPGVRYPVGVVRTVGGVVNAGALATNGSSDAILTYRQGSIAPSLVVDYGADIGGVPTFDFGTSTASRIIVDYSETLANLGHDGVSSMTNFHSGDPQRTVNVMVAPPAGQRPQLMQGGERYERITLASPGEVALRRVGIRTVGGPDASQGPQGSFLSSDVLLNRIWYAGTYTLGLDQVPPGTSLGPGAVTVQHLLVDGAKRDRAVWSGDLLIANLTDYYTSDPAYARDSLALLLDHPASGAGALQPAIGRMSQPGPLPGACSPNPVVLTQCRTWSATYSMDVVTALDEYYRYTGDAAFVRRHWPAVVRQMAWDGEQVGPDGLVAVTTSDDVDWNLDRVAGEAAFVNDVYVQALHSAADLAAALGRTGQVVAWSRAARRVASAVNARLWDATTGLYEPSTTARRGTVQDANVMAVLSGVAGPGRASSVLQVLSRRLKSPYGPLSVGGTQPLGYRQDISPYMGGFNVLADFETGHADSALALIRLEWGFMVTHDPGGVDWERINVDGMPTGGSSADSAAHAWSTGPTAALSEYVVGVTPVTPGFIRWSVAPQYGDLQWAQGSVPTPHGPIAVRWRRSATTFVVTESAPVATSGTVTVPLIDLRGTIARNGTLVWSAGRPVRGVQAHRVGSSVVFTESAGTNTYASTAR